MKPRNLFIRYFFCLFLSFFIQAQAMDINDPLEQKIKLPKSKGTIYQLLNLITERTDLLFIYDSKIIDNEQDAFIVKGEYTVRSAIYTILGDKSLELRLVDQHILIHKTMSEIPVQHKDTVQSQTETLFTITGTLYDKETQDPIIYASVGLSKAGIGTITNQNGEFRLRLSDLYRNDTLHFSHLGYYPQDISCTILADKYSTFSLEPNTINLQEIIVRPVKPIVVLNEMLEKRKENYPLNPVYLTSFYREGIERKKGMVSLSEGVFKVRKTPFSSYATDQVKLLKMRKVSNVHEKDTIIARIKSGIHACLMLDIVKQVPDFLRAEEESPYVYTHAGITVVDNRMVDIIHFEQKETYKDPLYRGNVYIDKDNKALLKAEFEIHPDYIRKATNMFVERKSKNLEITPQYIRYTISYKQWDKTYYINHVRGDLYFKIKKKRFFFSSTDVHAWFEMVTCKVDKNEANRFSRAEILSTRTIFSETPFEYDNLFWGEFNVIIPENELYEAIRKISSKIEETGY